MANQRIKGQEVEVNVVAGGAVMSFTDINSFEFTQETETTEEGYLGEKSNRYDEYFKGWTASFGMHNSSPETLRFLEIIKDRAQRRTPGIQINIKATLAFPSGTRTRIIASNAFFDSAGLNFASRSEYGETTFNCKGDDWRRV